MVAPSLAWPVSRGYQLRAVLTDGSVALANGGMGKPAALKLAAFRERHGISLREAARLLGVSAPTVLDWERRRKVPSVASRRAIRIWTHGHIREEEWTTSRERAEEERARRVRPLRRSG